MHTNLPAAEQEVGWYTHEHNHHLARRDGTQWDIIVNSLQLQTTASRYRYARQLALIQLYSQRADQRLLLHSKYHHEVYVCPTMTARLLLFRHRQP